MREIVNKKLKKEADEVADIHNRAHAIVRKVQVGCAGAYEDEHKRLWKRVTGVNTIK
jgi:hypothetical protein